MSYYLTVNIEAAGTHTAEGDSKAGHMWYSLDDGLDCTLMIRQIGLEQSARVFGFLKTVLQIPPAACIPARNADVCGYKLLE
jgi:hypothetical protein